MITVPCAGYAVQSTQLSHLHSLGGEGAGGFKVGATVSDYIAAMLR